MKFHLRLQTDNRWIGGFYCRRENLAEQLRDLQEIADQWQSPIVATRVDRRGGRCGEEIIIQRSK